MRVCVFVCVYMFAGYLVRMNCVRGGLDEPVRSPGSNIWSRINHSVCVVFKAFFVFVLLCDDYFVSGLGAGLT